MIIGVIIKQPNERLDWDVDARNAYNNDASDFVSSTDINIVGDGNLTVTPIIDGHFVKLWVQGGNVGEYKIELTVHTNAGRLKEDEIIVQIEDF